MSFAIDRRVLFAGATGLFAAGCSNIIGPLPAPKLYVLQPKLPHDLPGSKVDWALTIQDPEAIASLDSDRIAILLPPANLDYYADAAWADRLPHLVQSALLAAFESSGRIAAVAPEADAVKSDYVLSTDMRDFEARLDQPQGAPVAEVRLGARVVNARSHEIVAYKSFAREQQAVVNSVEAAVEALAVAFTGVLGELVPWVLDRSMPA